MKTVQIPKYAVLVAVIAAAAALVPTAFAQAPTDNQACIEMMQSAGIDMELMGMSPENITSFCGCVNEAQQAGMTFRNRDLLMLHTHSMRMLENPEMPMDCPTLMQDVDPAAGAAAPDASQHDDHAAAAGAAAPDAAQHDDHAAAAGETESSGMCGMMGGMEGMGMMDGMGDMGGMMSMHHTMMMSMMQEMMMMHQEMMAMRQEMMSMRHGMMMRGMGMMGDMGGMGMMGGMDMMEGMDMGE